MCPAELKNELVRKKLGYVRMWIIIMNIIFLLGQIRNTRKEIEPLDSYILVIHWTSSFLTIFLLVRSYYDIKIIKIMVFLLQIRNYIMIYQKGNFLDSDDPHELIWGLVGGIIIVIWTQAIISFIFNKYENYLNVINSIILVFGVIHRIYGLSEMTNNLKHMLLPAFMFFSLYPSFFLIYRALHNLEVQSLKSVNQLVKENETIRYVSTEFYEMFHSLQEGLVVFKNNTVSFSNNTF